MALASLSKSLLSRMSISGLSSPVATSSQPSTSSTSSNGAVLSSSPVMVAGGNHRDNLDVIREPASLLLGSYSPIRNMELYPPKKKVIEDGCISEEIPFDLINGENIEYIGGLANGKLLCLTNYRLLATQDVGFYSVPLGLIEVIEVQAVKDSLILLCKDARTFRLTFPTPFKAHSFINHIQTKLRPYMTDCRNIFAFVYRAYRKDIKLDREALCSKGSPTNEDGIMSIKDSDAYRKAAVTSEYHRMGMGCVPLNGMGTGHTNGKNSSDRVWRISQCNSKYKVCATYPKLLIVPQSVSDEELLQSSKFRMSGRFPVVVWRHPSNGSVILRSSQPLVGVLSWRSSEDEKLLHQVSQACWESRKATPYQTSHQIRSQYVNGTSNGSAVNLSGSLEEEDEDFCRLIVMDLRSYTATLGNRAKGGGSECTDYYPNCDVQFKGLPNIHTVRKSFHQLRTVLSSDDQTSYLSRLESTQWLNYLCQLLEVAGEVVNVIHDSSLPILIHCSDGWDRTTQVVALAELMLDPYYRTIKGFQVLVEREWLTFGHKFGDRCGHTSDDTNQRSPVFLQWLDCVHQLMRQFPCDFQFNEQFLVKLGHHAYSCLFGTFLANSMKEREVWRADEDTSPVWALLHEDNADFINYLYRCPDKGELKILRPVANIHSMLLWKAMYCFPLLTPYSEISPLQIIDEEVARTSTDLPSGGNDVQEPTGSSAKELSVEIISAKNLDSGEISGSSRNMDSTHHEEDTTSGSDDLQDTVSGNSRTSLNNDYGTFDGTSETSPREQSHDISANKEENSADECNPCVNNLEFYNCHESLHIQMRSENISRSCACLSSTESRDGPCSSSPECTDNVVSRPCSSSSNLFDSNDHCSSSGDFASADHESNQREFARGRYFLREATPTLSRFSIGVDGLPYFQDTVQARLKEMRMLHQQQIQKLSLKLKEAKEKVLSANFDMTGTRRGGSGELNLDEKDAESPSSLGDWDCLEEGGEGVLWIPDHAATHCYGCGGEFWTVKRKHHCRSCGKVFCASCSNFFCQVPHEQLYGDVRVCEKCFYKLDGHLKRNSSQNFSPA